MKKFSLVLLLLVNCFSLYAKDILVLKDGTKVKGELISVSQGELVFQKTKGIQSEIKLSPEEVEFVKVANVEKLKELQESMYLQGIADAQIHHKRFGGNFCAGFFGGAIGFIIVAVTDAKEPNLAIVGEEKYKNLEYREGYNKKAKGKNLGAAGAGWAAGFVLLLILIGASNS
ncbi:hypothetical protein [Algoriphagus litoralis]|uniref:hypothetical protein n=1 Tax=Algoriphagus litoralis TaxID=2202829 RepID=UPI000DBA7DCB|nr:hypothetical protein [Algoriphagus litoralis]